jgi:hypothetical protein
VVIGLTVCAADSGCAQLGSFRDGSASPPPMLGALNPFRKDKKDQAAGGGDLYANRMRKPGSAPASNSAEGPKPAAETLAGAGAGASRPSSSRSLNVALQPPVPVREATAKDTAPAQAGALAQAGSLPGPSEAPKPKKAKAKTEAAVKAPSESNVAAIVAESRARLDALTSYQVQINRQERVGNALLDPEDVLLSIRRNPKAVRLEWVDGPQKGREVIYGGAENGGMMHINMPGAVVPRISMSPESPLVLKSSRHPITEAGLDNVVADLEKTLALTGKGDTSRGRLSYGGLENPGPLERPCHKLVRITPSGETWHVYLDPETKLPAMVQATDLQGELLERYVFRNPRPDPPALASADAFDPDKRWGPATGLLGRLARARGAATPQ